MERLGICLRYVYILDALSVFGRPSLTLAEHLDVLGVPCLSVGHTSVRGAEGHR